eukprot:m.418678 g.418678  ORF g.418678 m.418678 type:complete len:208 (+) comp31075_c0_seq1:214-837(+)
MRSSHSKGKSPGLARPADKAAAIRKQRAAWLNREADAPDGAALPFAANPSPHQGERQRTHGAPQRSHFADSHHDAGADDGERIDEFAEQLREASATEQRHRDAEREKAMCDIRMEVLEDEISGLAVEKEKLDRQLHKNHKSDEKVEAAHAALEAEVARFMRSVKQRKHALACEQATISERKRVINEQRAENDAQVRLIQDTLLTLRR